MLEHLNSSPKQASINSSCLRARTYSGWHFLRTFLHIYWFVGIGLCRKEPEMAWNTGLLWCFVGFSPAWLKCSQVQKSKCQIWIFFLCIPWLWNSGVFKAFNTSCMLTVDKANTSPLCYSYLKEQLKCFNYFSFLHVDPLFIPDVRAETYETQSSEFWHNCLTHLE